MYLILLRPHGCLWAIHRSRAAQGSGERELWTSLLPIERAWAFLCPVFAAIAALACLVAVLQAAV
jgi:hypothetical protein